MSGRTSRTPTTREVRVISELEMNLLVPLLQDQLSTRPRRTRKPKSVYLGKFLPFTTPKFQNEKTKRMRMKKR
jgi:hypothetical protein